jgi:hypothetical protein
VTYPPCGFGELIRQGEKQEMSKLAVTMQHTIISKITICVLLSLCLAEGQTVKRGRDEATISISPSNVMGNGNLTMFLESIVRYSLNGFAFDPVLGAQIGVSNMMQLTGQFVPVAKKGIGPVEAHLQITTPGNDNLRFFGAALRADLFLSSAQDTLALTAQVDKPEYNPYLLASIIADVDWLALWRFFPVKTYLIVGMMDNIEQLPFYDQISIKSALEWKKYQHSAFFGCGMGFYREKQNRKNPGDNWYKQHYFWIEPGGRYRLLGRYSIVGSTKLTLSQKVKEKNPIKPELFNVALKLEVPILLRETNTEVIRTLIFMERKKGKKLDSFEKKVVTGKSLISEMNTSSVDVQDSLGTVMDQEEKEAIRKRREETQAKMDEIGRLFMQLDKEENKGVPMKTDTNSTGK